MLLEAQFTVPLYFPLHKNECFVGIKFISFLIHISITVACVLSFNQHDASHKASTLNVVHSECFNRLINEVTLFNILLPKDVTIQLLTKQNVPFFYT